MIFRVLLVGFGLFGPGAARAPSQLASWYVFVRVSLPKYIKPKDLTALKET